MIIGITGSNYLEFLQSLTGDNIFYVSNESISKKQTVNSILSKNNIFSETLNQYLKDLDLEKEFLEKRICDLSHSEIKLFKYLQMLISNASILVIDEPLLDLDYLNSKRIIVLFNQLVKRKTIIIGSSSTDIIYSLCKKVLLLNKSKYLYDDVSILANKSVLRRFHLVMPEILCFIRMANDKKIKLPYVKDVRDLIKDVYRHVSK